MRARDVLLPKLGTYSVARLWHQRSFLDVTPLSDFAETEPSVPEAHSRADCGSDPGLTRDPAWVRLAPARPSRLTPRLDFSNPAGQISFTTLAFDL